MRRLVAQFVLVGVFGVLLVVPAVATPDEELLLIELVDQARAEASLPPLEADVDLIVAARGHSGEMASEGELYHSTRGALASYADDWELMGENVGRGPNVRAIHDAFIDSPSHRDNILGDFDAIGIGVERAEDGTLFVTTIFMRRTPGTDVAQFDNGPMILISGLPEFAVSRLMAAAEIFERSGRELCSPVGSSGSACIH